ncbi:MAG: L,D-transpeptidase family protein [Campylobacterota bacterium]|nr:L,D-transpeptidase family protein [Campylobacterota bacterium]
MKNKILLAVAFMLLLSGCGDLFGPDRNGWKSSQKKEFLQILENDTYMSLCNQEALYTRIKSSNNSRLMSQLLVSYAKNLANSCIDLKSFNHYQKAKKAQKINTHYDTNQEKIYKYTILHKLRSGQTIKQILQPYVPKSPQFKALSKRYRALKQPHAKVTKEHLHKIRLNIERTKLMKHDLGINYALINIPEFNVRMIENNVTKLKFSVIVGKKNLQTPIFSERLKYIEINPQWNIPDSIMRESYISKIIRNPNWIKSKGMELHKDSYSLKSPKVNPRTVNWKKYMKENDKSYIPYKLVQVPSPKNGLGRVKFIFPNKHAVYMHDTQTKSLFKRSVRAYSHGCIRLGKPMRLLNYIATNYTNKSLGLVNTWYKSLKTKHLVLNKPLEVHTAYFTAYVNELGKLKLYNDIYGFDASQKLNFRL